MTRLVFVALALILVLNPGLLADPARAAPRERREARELRTGRLAAALALAQARRPDRLSVEDRYIVVLKGGAGEPLKVAKGVAAATAGVVPTHVYRHVFAGFAAEIPPGKLAAVRNDPRVRAVVPDRLIYTTAELPTGVDRIGGDQNATADIDGTDDRVNVDVAIIDSAGDDVHPDLNIWAWANCTDSANDSDDVGHGTHVGGTVGALDNGTGVVGVAPGARLWNIRVLRLDPGTGNGVGAFSWIICGLDLVAQYATDQGDDLGTIEVANASLGAQGTDSTTCPTAASPFHQAFCDVVDAGITMVVAAGNNFQDAAGFVPASYDELITVSALADSDGQPGGTGPGTSGGPDDTFANFSNFGADVDLGAPGVDIQSTYLAGDYASLSGTSMASPHVAGAAALLIAANGSASPQAVKNALIAGREQFDMPNDPDPTAEGIVNVADGNGPDDEPPTVDVNAPKRPKAGKRVTIGATATDNVGVDSVAFGVCRGASCTWAAARSLGADDTAPFSTRWKAPKKGTFTFLARASDEAGNQATSDPVTVKVKPKPKKRKKAKGNQAHDTSAADGGPATGADASAATGKSMPRDRDHQATATGDRSDSGPAADASRKRSQPGKGGSAR